MNRNLLEAAHETAKDFYEIGLLDQKTMREFDVLCTPNKKRKTSSKKTATGIGCGKSSSCCGRT